MLFFLFFYCIYVCVCSVSIYKKNNLLMMIRVETKDIYIYIYNDILTMHCMISYCNHHLFDSQMFVMGIYNMYVYIHLIF